MGRGQALLPQQDFSAGISRAASPAQTDPRAVYDHLNGLYADDGAAFKRGGTEYKSAAAFGTSLRWLWDGYFDAGQRTLFANTADFGVLDTDDTTVVNLGGPGLGAPVSSALLEGMLFIGGGYIYGGSRKAANYTTGTITATNGSKTVTGAGVTWNTLVDAGMLLQVGNERVYVVASIDSTTQITLRDAYEGTTGAGKAYTLHNFYEITGPDPYPDSELYAVVANRLVVARDSAIDVSEVQKPHNWNATIVGGTPATVPTTHAIPGGVRITGLSTIGQTLLVHTSGGIWTVEGLTFNIVDSFGTPQHRVNRLSDDMVLWAPSGIASWQQALVVPCLDGIYLLDGISAPEPIARPIEALYRDYIARGYRPGGAIVYRGHYFLPVLSASGSAVRDLLVCRLDRVVESRDLTSYPWSRLGGSGGTLSALAVRHLISAVEPKLFGAENQSTARVVDCTGFFAPDDSNTTDADATVHEWWLVSRDYETGGMTVNMVRWLKSTYELVGTGAVIDFDYGFGYRNAIGYNWDEWDWAEAVAAENDLFWAEDDEDEYLPLNCAAPPDTGGGAHRCRVNQPTRHIRIRARNSTPCSRLRMKSLELAVRPSRAGRR